MRGAENVPRLWLPPERLVALGQERRSDVSQSLMVLHTASMFYNKDRGLKEMAALEDSACFTAYALPILCVSL